MAEFRSKKAVVSKAPYELYMAFVDMRNFVQFLPEDKKADVCANRYSIVAFPCFWKNLQVFIQQR